MRVGIETIAYVYAAIINVLYSKDAKVVIETFKILTVIAFNFGWSDYVTMNADDSSYGLEIYWNIIITVDTLLLSL